MFDATRKFMSAQFEMKAATKVQLVTLIVHFFFCWFFVSVLQWREVGAAMATNITYILNMIGLELYCICDQNLKRTYPGLPDKTAFKNISTYLEIGVPGACMLCFEWWCFELLAIFSGLMGVQALAAEVIVVNIVSMIFMVPLGISYSASAFTGYFLGQGKIDKARKYSRLTLCFNIFVTTVIIVFIILTRKSISSLFTQDAGTVKIVDDVFDIICYYIFFDTIHGVQSGIIRGLGLQVYGSVYTLVCYYLVGLPLALWFAFSKSKGVCGLWLGFAIACVVLDMGYLCIIECPDWRKISERMQQKIDKERMSKVTDSVRFGRRLKDEAYAGNSATNQATKNFQRAQAIHNSAKMARRSSSKSAQQ